MKSLSSAFHPNYTVAILGARADMNLASPSPDRPRCRDAPQLPDDLSTLTALTVLAAPRPPLHAEPQRWTLATSSGSACPEFSVALLRSR